MYLYKKSMKYFSFLVFLLLIGISCHKQQVQKQIQRETMRICVQMDPTSMDPRKNADPCTSCLNFLIYEGLTQMGKNGSVELALAEKIDISEDGRIYTFYLRDAIWSDGEPITAYDFEHSWRKTLSPQFSAACPHLFYPIKNAQKALQGIVPITETGIQAIDAKTLRIELENPTPYFLSLITFCNFYPIPRHVEIQNPSWECDFNSPIVQSGPFKLEKWKRSKEIFLTKNEHYWNADNIHLNRIHISIIPDERTSLEMFLNDELDCVTTLTMPIPLDGLAECRRKGILQAHPIGGLIFCTFNVERFPFDNANIRKALSLSIDRRAITENIMQLSETPATQFIPPIFLNSEERPLFSPHDPQLAKEYLHRGLQELGIDLQQISDALILSFEGKDQNRKIAQTIQSQWKTALNLDAKLFEADQKSILQKHMNRDYHVGLDHAIAQYSDPSNILDRFKYKITKKNLPGFENSEYIRLLDEASLMNDPQKRFTVLRQAEEILAKEMPIAPLFYYQQGELVNPKFTNIEFSPVGNLLFRKVIPLK